MNKPKFKKISNFIFQKFWLLVLLLFTLFPLVWLILTSIKPRLLTFAIPPAWTFKPTLEHYFELFNRMSFGYFIYNSAIIALGTTSLALLVAAPSAFSFSFFSRKWNNGLLLIMLALRMIPPIALVIPIYNLVRQIGLMDTRIALIFVHSTFTIPFTIWMLKGFFDEIPHDLVNSALVDGCSYITAFIRIIIPITGPGLVATALFSFILSWNDFLFALILSGTNSRTLPVAASGFITDEGVYWGQVGAGGIIILIPVILFTLLLQRHLVRGMTAGAVKG